MIKKLAIFTYFFLQLSCFLTSAQIKSNSYRTLLKTLYKDDVPLISCADAHKTRAAALFLDTRAKEEFNVSHIPNARWVGYEDFTLDRVKDMDKNTPVIVYCSVGVRSEKVGRQLMQAGFTNVQNLYGSLFEWVNQDYPIVDSAGKPTKKVHAYSRSWGVWLQKGDKVYE